MATLLKDDPSLVLHFMKTGLPKCEETAKAIPLPNSLKKGYSHVYRNAYVPEKLIAAPHPSLTTLHDVFEFPGAVFPTRDALGSSAVDKDGNSGPYVFETYGVINKRKQNFGSGLLFVLNNNPFLKDIESHRKITSHFDNKGDSFVVTLYSANRKEWLISDMACAAFSICNTALYDSLGPDASKYILTLTESPVIVCSKDKIRTIIDLKTSNPEQLQNLITIISMDSLDRDDVESGDSALISSAREAGLTCFDFLQVEKIGEINPLPYKPPSPETRYTISFTSGTTGSMPKGVVLKHRNAVCSILLCFAVVGYVENVSYYSFLPLAHIYERMTIAYAYLVGSSIGFPLEASPLSLLSDVKKLRPHILSLVPRVYTKLEAALKLQTVENDNLPILRDIFRKAIGAKARLQAEKDGAEGRHLIYDQIVGLLRKKTGFDRVKLFFSGSAPISVETVKFIKSALNAGMVQGYGLTETFAGICASIPYERSPGSCGAISITTEVRLREIPEMNYLATDEGGPRGEILLRGPQVFEEYYKDPSETEKAFDEDGWFKTGDIGRIEAGSGKLYIIDRVKNFFKLAQGEYITPERIENIYLSSFPVLAQLFVHGESIHTSLVAIAGVEVQGAVNWLHSRFNIDPKELTSNDQILEYLNDKEIRKEFLKEMNASTGKQLQGYEKVHNLSIQIDPLTVERNIITPTMKIKRPLATKFFKDDFNRMYEEGSLLRNNNTKL